MPMNVVLAAAQSKSVPGDVSRNVARHLLVAAMASRHGAHLLVFPELSLTGYELGLARANVVDPESVLLLPLRQLAQQAGMTIVAGAPVLGGNDELHIAALAFGADGSLAMYTKEHVHSSEQPVFTSGPGGAALVIADASVALAICADASHPAHAAKAASRGAQVYAVGAMIDEAGYERKSALLEGYAKEHRMAVLLANYSGVTGGERSAGRSAIWSEDGRLVAASSGSEEAIVIGTKRDGVWSGRVVTLVDHR
jgi:predicted amidohydrolase